VSDFTDAVQRLLGHHAGVAHLDHSGFVHARAQQYTHTRTRNQHLSTRATIPLVFIMHAVI